MTTGQAVRSTDEIREGIVVRAEPARVWRALTDPAELLVWWGDPSAYRCTGWTFAPVPGSAWRVEGTNVQGGALRVDGEILEADPPRSLAYTWRPSWIEVPATIVRITLEPAGLAALGLGGLSPSAGRSSGRAAERHPLARTVRRRRLNLSPAPAVVCRVPRSPPP